jgi:hypothetical protein
LNFTSTEKSQKSHAKARSRQEVLTLFNLFFAPLRLCEKSCFLSSRQGAEPPRSANTFQSFLCAFASLREILFFILTPRRGAAKKCQYLSILSLRLCVFARACF